MSSTKVVKGKKKQTRRISFELQTVEVVKVMESGGAEAPDIILCKQSQTLKHGVTIPAIIYQHFKLKYPLISSQGTQIKEPK